MKTKKYSTLKWLNSIAFFIYAVTNASFSLAAIRSLSLEKLTAEASVIVIGNVKETKSEWKEGQPITTDVVIEAKNFLKTGVSNPKNNIIVRVYGGEVDGTGLAVSTEPVFKKGEEVLVFLKAADAENIIYRPVNGEQGKFTITAANKIIENNLDIVSFIEQIKMHVK